MSSIIDSTYDRVKQYLHTIYGADYTTAVTEYEQSFIIRQGSAAVHLTLKPWHEEDCIVQALSYVVVGAAVTAELSAFLLRENARTPFGAFGVLFVNTITFGHAIAGAHLDLNELRTTVRHVAFMADEYDDMIREIAGGYRAVDANALLMSEPVPAFRKPAPAKRKAKPAPKKKAAPRKVLRAPAKKKAGPAPKKKPVKKSAPKIVLRKPASKPARKPLRKKARR
jgi:hypothetical protein